MNVQQYASILSRFNHVPAVEATSENVIVVHFSETRWNPSLVGRLRSFDKIVYHSGKTRPFVRALRVFYRTDCITTVFLSRHRNRRRQQTVLMGNERVLVPATERENGCVHLCIFPFFVRDPDAAFRLKACGGGEGVYAYRDGVLFADPGQVPYPGGSYYDEENAAASGRHQRVCFLTRHADVASEVYADWYGKRGVLFFPFQTKTTALKLLSDFFPLPVPVSDVCFPNTHLKSSGSVHKRLSQEDPSLLLQDVLNTYASANASSSNALDNVALFVEYPFVSGFENSCGGKEGCVATGGDVRCSLDPAGDGSPPRYVGFLINGLNPKTVLRVRHPYDRYAEYQKIDSGGRGLESDRTVFLYERFHDEFLPADVEPVRVENTVLGYKYKNAFFCLSYPMLADAPRRFDERKGEEEEEDQGDVGLCDRVRPVRNAVNYNTDCLLNPVERFDPRKDPGLLVTGTYNYDETYDVYQVKHRRLRNELWCLVDKRAVETLGTCKEGTWKRKKPGEDATTAAGAAAAPKYFRKASAPLTKFVYEWIDFFYKNADKKFFAYGSMNAFRLAMVLARHKICLSLERAPYRSVQSRGGEYVFRLDQPAIDFINDMRLSTATDRIEKEEASCIIL